jgi:ParB family transcriptional regulator, chromosome partitioning protein
VTTSTAGNLAVEKATEKVEKPLEKKDDKAEKRKALGRGLASLLPGPRVVPSSLEQRVPSIERSAVAVAPLHGGNDVGEQQVPHFVRNDKGEERSAKSEDRAGQPRTSASALAPDALPTLEPAETREISISAQRTPQNVVVNLSVDSIEKNPYQTRYVFDEAALIELRDSIKEHGVVQPVVVRPAEGEDGRYILVLGERRLRASKMAGKGTIPALVRTLSLQQAAEMTVLENVVRADLNPVEQAEAFRVLSKEFHLTQAQIAERIGVSRETVANYMRLLRLPQKVMGYMLEGRLSFSDARELLRLEKEEHIEMVAEELVMKRLKWDEIDDRVRKLNEPLYAIPGETDKKRSAGARWMDPNVRAAQTEMERTLGLRVRIRDRNGKGKITIEYATVDDYERVVEKLRAN